MERCQSTRKIHDESAIRKNVPPNKNIVWRVQGGQTHDIRLDIGGRQNEPDSEVGSDDGGAAGFMDFPTVDWFETELAGEPRTHSRSSSARIDLSKDRHQARSLERNGGDSNLDRWPILDKLIDRLGNSDLGPGGFFVICHRDSDFRPE